MPFDSGVNAPSGMSFAPPLMPFMQAADLPNDYFQGQQRARTTALQSAFAGGVPKNPDGSIDIAMAIRATTPPIITG
jgi:hypothetical protein